MPLNGAVLAVPTVISRAAAIGTRGVRKHVGFSSAGVVLSSCTSLTARTVTTLTMKGKDGGKKRRTTTLSPSSSSSSSSSSDDADAASVAAAPAPAADGLFGIPCLRRPADFARLAQKAMRRCDCIRSILSSSLLCSSSSSSSTLSARATETLYLLDDISNAICSVIDAAELCRNAHASPEWREHAHEAFGSLSRYMSELNGDDSLYRALLAAAVDDGGGGGDNDKNMATFSTLTHEQRRFATSLRDEFERDGIHLPPDKRVKVMELTEHIATLESLFATNLIRNGRKVFDVTADAEQVVPRHILQTVVPDNAFTNRWGMTTVSTDSHIANALLKYSPNPSLRKDVYMNVNTLCPENLDVLDALVRRRDELARLQGYQSYAHRTLVDKMARTTDAVESFLDSVKIGNEGHYRRDMELVLNAKDQIEAGVGKGANAVQPWDVPFYTGILKAQLFGRGGGNGNGADVNELGGYFTVDGCVEGMAMLVERLFGIDMAEVDVTRWERWDVVNDDKGTGENGIGEGGVGAGNKKDIQGIRKFQFTHPEEGPLGTVYFDLHPREGKYGHAAHFTVRCGCAVRRPTFSSSIYDDDNDTDYNHDYNNDINPTTTTATSSSSFDIQGEYQLPIVALVCNLSPPHANIDGHALLSHSELETLMHEFGHALHSLLSRTTFQHLAGTRAAMDFIETPSHIFENYAWDYNFLKVVGRHYRTGEVLHDDVIDASLRGRYAFKSIEVQTQIVYSKFDQALFGRNYSLDAKKSMGTGSSSSSSSSTALFESLHRTHGLPYAPGTHFHSRFGHLVTYGAGYYGYLYSQVFASDVWSTVLSSSSSSSLLDAGGGASGSMSREGGMRLWNEVLRHGGAKDPNVMLRNVLGGREPNGSSFFDSLDWTRPRR